MTWNPPDTPRPDDNHSRPDENHSDATNPYSDTPPPNTPAPDSFDPWAPPEPSGQRGEFERPPAGRPQPFERTHSGSPDATSPGGKSDPVNPYASPRWGTDKKTPHSGLLVALGFVTGIVLYTAAIIWFMSARDAVSRTSSVVIALALSVLLSIPEKTRPFGLGMLAALMASPIIFAGVCIVALQSI